MDYMLVLQFPENFFDYDKLIDFENSIIELLDGIGDVDGHDIGSGEVNLYIIVNDIDLVVDKIMLFLNTEEKNVLKAAYREVNGEEYNIIYPPNLKEFCII